MQMKSKKWNNFQDTNSLYSLLHITRNIIEFQLVFILLGLLDLSIRYPGITLDDLGVNQIREVTVGMDFSGEGTSKCMAALALE